MSQIAHKRSSQVKSIAGAFARPVNGRSVGGHQRPQQRVETEDDDNVYIFHNGQPTHVVVPVEAYERLVKSEMALHTIVATENRNDEDWIDADDFAIELARDAIVKARKAAGLTQKQLGAKIGVPQSQISRIERNPDRTTVRTLKRLAKALRVNVSAFI